MTKDIDVTRLHALRERFATLTTELANVRRDLGEMEGVIGGLDTLAREGLAACAGCGRKNRLTVCDCCGSHVVRLDTGIVCAPR